MQLVDRDRAPGGERHALRARCLALLAQADDAEEHEGAVLPPQLLGAVRIGTDPFADAVHRHLVARHQIALDQDPADGRIGVSVMAVVIDPDDQAVLEPHARRALDLDEQRIGRVLDPADLEMLPVEHPVLDLGAVVIGHELARAVAPPRLAGVGKTVAARAGGRQQVGRAAIDRHVVDAGRKARSAPGGNSARRIFARPRPSARAARLRAGRLRAKRAGIPHAARHTSDGSRRPDGRRARSADSSPERPRRRRRDRPCSSRRCRPSRSARPGRRASSRGPERRGRSARADAISPGRAISRHSRAGARHRRADKRTMLR